ncbi:DedA family protein [uncultured Cellulomonas sp.]|uniref:DedA family protein n=1 Tax=uncultured Cellulomonas sp. TaxID=189682 RepID=UPI0028E55BB8|nr:DedA family protein [uncultured Cellulomonas sp.]
MLEGWALALVGSPWIFVVLYLFATIDGFFPPIPSESVVIALAAVSMAEGTPNLWLLMLVAAAGAWSGDQIAYLIGTRVKVRQLRLLRSRRGQAAVDWAESALENRGAAFIIAARYIPVGRVAVNMTAGAVGYSRRRFMGLTAIAALTWGCYSTLIGIGAGAWLHDNTVLAVVVGVIGGLAIGLVVDWVLRKLIRRGVLPPAVRTADGAGGVDGVDQSPLARMPVAPPVTGRSRSDPAA